MNEIENNTTREQNDLSLPTIKIFMSDGKLSLFRNGNLVWKDVEINEDFRQKVSELDPITQSALKLFIQESLKSFLLRIFGFTVGTSLLLYGVYTFFSSLGEALAQLF